MIVPGGLGRQRNILPWVIPLSLLGAWGRNQVRKRILGELPSEMTEGQRRFSAMHDAISKGFQPRYVTLPIFGDEQLASLDMPVMLVVAGRDVMLDPVAMKRRAEEHIPHLTLRYLPDARHYPGSQADAVSAFLSAP